MNLTGYLRFAIGQLLDLEVEQPILPTVYETSWITRLTDTDGGPRHPDILADLANSQHPDGSWGSRIPHYHDHFLTTLAMVLALARFGQRDSDHDRRRAGERYLWQNTFRLGHDPHRTVGFELILPTLLAEGERLGLNLPYSTLGDYEVERQHKLALLPPDAPFDGQSSALFSLEAFTGRVGRADPDTIRALLLEDGSVATSPSATAFMLSETPDWDRSFPESRDYLYTLLKGYGGRLPTVAPCDIFIRAWMLNHLHHGGLLRGLEGSQAQALQAIHHYLLASWRPGGVGWASIGPPESDDTAMVLLALHRAGYEVDGSCLLNYERAQHFAVLEYERDPSVSANLHVLEALETLPVSERERVAKKVVNFLQGNRIGGSYWRDKWHASAYYPTSRALLVLIPHLPPEQLEPTVRWLLATQNPGGSWGEYRATTEETALVLISLLHYHRRVHPLPESPLRLAVSYIMSTENPFGYDYPELWISKTLYAPAIVIKSVVVAALGLYADTFGEDSESLPDTGRRVGGADEHRGSHPEQTRIGQWSP